MTTLLLLTGPSGSGKTSLANKLKNFGFVESISHTTREKRKGEKDQFESNSPTYFYVTKEEFLKLKKENSFIESVEFNNNMYGVSKEEILKHDFNVLIVENEGLKQILKFTQNKKDINVKTIFLNVTKEEQLKRMRERGDSEQSIKSRLSDDNISKTMDIDLFDIILNTNKMSLDKMANIANILTKD